MFVVETAQVRVPYRVVGLVVGPKGATIKRIQQQTSTYIVTPSREKEPIFEVTGMPDNVEQAKREIEAHIALRTGLVSVDGTSGDPLASAGNQSDLHDLTALNGLGLGMLGIDNSLSSMATSDLMNSLYKAPSALRTAFATASMEGSYGLGSSGLSNLFTNNTVDYATPADATKLDSELQTLGSGLLNSLYDSDEGIGLGGSDSPTLSHSLIQPNIWSTDFGLGSKRSNSFGFAAPESAEHPPARRISSDPLTAIGSTLSSLSAAFQIRNDSDSGVLRDSSASASGTASPVVSPVGSSSNSSTRGSLKRECILCCEGEMVAALVPCGHKLFCMDCAQRLVKGEAVPAGSDAASGQCPVCHQPVTQAIRIFS